MKQVSSSAEVIRFGVFEADTRTGELRKHGLRIKLQEQPFQVLSHLLARPGELVTREEFDVQAELLSRAQARLEALEARVAELEAQKK